MAVLQSGLVPLQHLMTLSLLSAWLLPAQAEGWLAPRVLTLLHLCWGVLTLLPVLQVDAAAVLVALLGWGWTLQACRCLQAACGCCVRLQLQLLPLGWQLHL
jgi:hypothetical protein